MATADSTAMLATQIPAIQSKRRYRGCSGS